MSGTQARKNGTPYGDELKARREQAGLTQAELAALAFMTHTHIAHIEAGRRIPSLSDARRLDDALQTGGVFVRFLPDAKRRKVAKHFEAARELESQASMIREFGLTLIPGLLQTEAYMRAVFRAYFPVKSKQKLEEAVTTRLERAHILEDPLSPHLTALLDEAALRRPHGGLVAMAEQLRHIVALGERDRVRVHVLPYGVGCHALIESNLRLMWFEDMPPVAYTDGLHSGNLIDEEAVVLQCQTSYDLALGDALSHEKSLALLREIAEEYEHEHRSTGMA
ncbi:helix-turn-helix domain-containing protein [Streptomyces candidus]|uniref:Transcriptional regulator with XRE-family HTH domain n=1 Tax=Streptomyces candidus TaxID=67283 RepID=A0A7X0LQC7_9ACTN|nr:helix-turn-helix transcriptional regulator [Streptomyces candidus]MBB6437473.1 transcriptional regulator with XRE-family HTH domain [Streptomyces candidus]GHH54293.1 transcriptional regulator [Streptomyces candidus]